MLKFLAYLSVTVTDALHTLMYANLQVEDAKDVKRQILLNEGFRNYEANIIVR
ncbi:MAG TPA: hypothetical protein VH500_11120 [Nitrososphaeraceae archaeon]|jgi:hypothetical protein